MTSKKFPDGFLWGAATASYQIEGAVDIHGRGESIWDRFSHTQGHISGAHTGDTACDHYNRYREDVRLMAEIGLKSYRFSVAWPRIFPQGGGKVNAPGMDFYDRLVDELLDRNIEPMTTIYHWDLPQALQEKGGWSSRDTVEYFTDYSYTLFDRLGDRVHLWITHNEPWVTAFLGHADGVHAPGIRSFSVAIQVAHHLILSHARAVQAYRALQAPEGRIGIALSLTPAYPAGDSQEDMEAARRADGFQNRWFLDPVLKGLYPADMMEIYQERYERPVLETGDMDLISRSPCDFLGVNYYTRRIVHNGGGGGPLFETSEPRDCPVTEMGWEVYPEGLYTLLLRLETEYDHPVLFITENGAAFEDSRTAEGRIEDEQRVSFAREHLLAAHRAIQKGVDLQGYYLWSLMDNFEWSHGYSKRFGILYTDYQTQERIWKKSAYWYRDVIRNNGLEESQG